MLFVLFVLLLVVSPIEAYRQGDYVPMLKRSQYKGYRTAWSEVPAQDAPHFGLDKTIMLHPSSSAKVYDGAEELKVSFSFDHDRLLTSWVTVVDGRGNYLTYVQFNLVYSGDRIIKVTWKADYHGIEEHMQRLAQSAETASKGTDQSAHQIRPEHIFIRYYWIEQMETDAASGLTFLLVLSTIVTWCLGILVVLGLDSNRRPSVKSF